MPDSNKRKNVPESVTATRTYPTSATALTIDALTSFKYERGFSHKTFNADGHRFDTAVFSDKEEPTFTFDTMHPDRLKAVLATERYTVAATIPDAISGTASGGGGYTLTATNCYLKDIPLNMKHRDWSDSTYQFGMISTDGVTHPVSVVAL